MTEISSISANINSLGQILDIIGVCVIFKFGLPNFSHIHAGEYIEYDPSENEQKEIDLYVEYSVIGLGLLIGGFLCQIVSNYI